jgi:hypothetical protein
MGSGGIVDGGRSEQEVLLAMRVRKQRRFAGERG